MGNLFSRGDEASNAAEIQEYLDQEENFHLNIAVTGESGSGKSTFVNTIRGLKDDDEGAAPTGIVETTIEVTPYSNPDFPNVTFWDLPGIGTMNYPAAEYLKKIGFEKFDFFIIVSADRFTENDVKLAKEIQKMKKKFYFVRSKIDQNIHSEERKKDFDKERTLGRIRENCIQGLQKQGFKSPQVFLVSSFEPKLYDFPLLLETLEGELPKLKRDAFLSAMPKISLFSRIIAGNLFSRRSIEEEVREALQKNDEASAAAKIQEYLNEEDNIPLNIAVTGETGSGKSTFVNAIRGVDDGDEGAAPTGVIETTMEVTPYPHPNFPNVTVWDLPGIGTMNFPAAEYLKKIGFEKFDFFIIISADRFRENDVKLAKEIQKMEKKFYFVRSKIDENIRSEKRKKDFNEERTLRRIREYCIQGLQIQGFESPHVFLVSSYELHLYDFPQLLKTLEGELPELKRDAFLIAMPNTSLEMIDRKKKAFKSKIKYIATLSAAVAAVPVPGLSIAVDLSLLVSVVTRYVFGFGLDISSLKRLSNYTGVPYAELKNIIMSPLAATVITPAVIIKTLIQTACIAALMLAEEGSRFIPILGIPVSMALSYTTTYKGLNLFLDVLAEDAQRVLKKALGLNT